MPALGYLHNFWVNRALITSYMMIGYDEVEAVQFLGKRYKAYWAKDGKQLTDAFEDFHNNYNALYATCTIVGQKNL